MMRSTNPGHVFLIFPLCWMLNLGIAAAAQPTFEPQTIDGKIQIGYGVAIGDVNGDKRPDILLADKKQFVWYENPNWRRHVMVDNLTVRDNVCIAARDIDGDGRVEVAVGAAWNPGDTMNSGTVHYLAPTDDRTKTWTPIQLHHEPVVHRMRWVKVAEGKFQLVVAPLHGRGNRGGEGKGVKLIAYDMPADPKQPWKTTVIEDTLHVTHNFDVCQWIAGTPAEEILYIGREGAMLLWRYDGNWSKKRIDRISGGGEIRMGKHSKGEQFVTAIEPLHGDKLVYYPASYRGLGAKGVTAINGREVLDDNFSGGHAIATADLFGNGDQQIVAGWRLKNRDGKVGVKLYYREDGKWRSMVIDDNKMATEDLRIADLNRDGRPDIIAAGRATKNLVVYWNKPSSIIEPVLPNDAPR